MNFFILVSNQDIAGENIKNNLIRYFNFEKFSFNDISLNDKIFNKNISIANYFFSNFNNNFHNFSKKLTNTNFINNNYYTLKNYIDITLNHVGIYLFDIMKDTIFFDIDKFCSIFDVDYIIFATRHQSKSAEKTLSIHYTGNFDKALYGGIEGEFSIVDPIFMKIAFLKLNQNAISIKRNRFDITLEATHHGPLIKKPHFFIEIGSTEFEWQNKEAGYVIAKTIIDTIYSFIVEKNNDFINFSKTKYSLCFGGLHYCANFNKILIEKDVCFSHICPKYKIKFLNKEKLSNMLTSSIKKIDFALLDWKGINSEDKQFLIELFSQVKLPYKKLKEL